MFTRAHMAGFHVCSVGPCTDMVERIGGTTCTLSKLVNLHFLDGNLVTANIYQVMGGIRHDMPRFDVRGI